MRARVVVGIALAAAVLALAGTGRSASSGPAATAGAFGVRVIVPGGSGSTAASISSPPQASASLAGWSHGDGAVVTGAITAATLAVVESGRASSGAQTSVASVSLFRDAITAGLVDVEAGARANGSTAGGGLSGSSLSDVTVFGQAVQPAANARIELGDWGYAVFLEQAVVRESDARRGRRVVVTGIHVRLTAEHGGLPAGSQILVGYAEAAASAPTATAPPPTTSEPAPKPEPKSAPPPDPVPSPPGAKPEPPPAVEDPPAGVKPKLTAKGYVFPVYGPASFSDDFAAARAVTGWHHGNDIFAPLGAPVLAVANGTLSLVGWNAIGGNRLWLRDEAGNEFYYAHLAAFSPLARNGARVRAGDVVGFVGATGDAVGTPPHLHFEVHPAQLLWMGYDGVVNPYLYLLAWERRHDASFEAAAWTPPPGKAPPPPAVLLEAADIAGTSGLDPARFADVLATPPLFAEGLPGPTIVEAPPAVGRR